MEQMSIFDYDDHPSIAPLADRLRPKTLDDFVGQTHLVGPGCILRRLIERDEISSMIFWGRRGWEKQLWHGSSLTRPRRILLISAP